MTAAPTATTIGGASGGAGIKTLMARVGHDSERAAMIYLHEARARTGVVTAAIDAHIEASRTDDGDDDDGMAGVLAPVG
jgi:hypothetical protein